MVIERINKTAFAGVRFALLLYPSCHLSLIYVLTASGPFFFMTARDSLSCYCMLLLLLHVIAVIACYCLLSPLSPRLPLLSCHTPPLSFAQETPNHQVENRAPLDLSVAKIILFGPTEQGRAIGHTVSIFSVLSWALSGEYTV